MSSMVNAQETKVLIFTKTKGFRHQSIEKGREVLASLLQAENIRVDSTENAELFTNKNLKQYDALIFLNTTGDLFDEKQQQVLVNYIRNGGGYVGIHASTDAEYDWPWYGQMAGGYFKSHPKQQNAVIKVVDKTHPSTTMLPDEWNRFDEWYDFKDVNPNIKVLAKLDETSYEGGEMQNDHPIIWYQEFEGGRIFYTGFGHTNETFEEPLFREHVMGGIMYAIGK
ncbi:MAG: ThuA domain-containing protein [Cyclobacteriaceae bacterium]|nr:ThuA domain-containing protein [Cyclobacteriaceae bacterium]